MAPHAPLGSSAVRSALSRVSSGTATVSGPSCAVGARRSLHRVTARGAATRIAAHLAPFAGPAATANASGARAPSQSRGLRTTPAARYAAVSEASSPADYLATAARYRDVRFPVEAEDPGQLIEDTVDRDADLFKVGSPAELDAVGPDQRLFLFPSPQLN